MHIGHQLPLDLTRSGFISGGILNSRTMWSKKQGMFCTSRAYAMSTIYSGVRLFTFSARLQLFCLSSLLARFIDTYCTLVTYPKLLSNMLLGHVRTMYPYAVVKCCQPICFWWRRGQNEWTQCLVIVVFYEFGWVSTLFDCQWVEAGHNGNH